MLCPVCNSKQLSLWAKAIDAEYFSTAEEAFSYFRCNDCFSLVIDPMPKDRLSIIYPQNYYSYSPSYTSMFSRIKTLLDKRWFKKITRDLQGETLSALDVGGGTGLQLSVLRSADSRFTTTDVVDIDSVAEVEARRNGHSYFCGGIESYTANKKYDVILMLNLIEHVESPITVLRKAGELLSSQGKILLKTPNVDSLDARVFRNQSWAGYHCPRHWVLFTKESLDVAIRRAGLNTQYIAYTQGAPFWAASVLIALAKLGVVDISAQRPVAYHPLFGLITGVFAGFDFLRGFIFKTSQMFAVIGR
jgi:SAM-dependent methyltransferase